MDIKVSCICDPFEVIIKLCLLSYKKNGYKLSLRNNRVYIDEPSICQNLKRKLYGDSYLDLQYLYVPIELACKEYLKKDTILLFETAQDGILNLIETYNNNNMIILLLQKIYRLIDTYIEYILLKPDKSKIIKYSASATFDFNIFENINNNINYNINYIERLPRSEFDNKILEYYRNNFKYINRWNNINIDKIIKLLDNIEIFETYINNL